MNKIKGFNGILLAIQILVFLSKKNKHLITLKNGNQFDPFW